MALRNVALSVALLAALPAAAESGKLNFDLDVGLGAPFTGPYGTTFRGEAGAQAYGLDVRAALDYQVLPPLALELQTGLDLTMLPPLISRVNDRTYVYSFVPGFALGLGPRFRFRDDQTGYGDEKGSLDGNFWASAHVGIHVFDGAQFGLDAAMGYQYSLRRPFSIGPFARAELLFESQPLHGTTFRLVVGATMSWELLAQDVPVVDTDGDGLSDADEANKYGTDPTNPDTDGDGLSDGLEVHTATNPIKRDTDGDGLEDQVEDANQNGSLDKGETDPRQYDTDKDGIKDGAKKPLQLGPAPAPKAPEATPTPKPVEPPPDADGDGVSDGDDKCPDTAAKLTVDEKGCVVVRAELVLEGVVFDTGKADIRPDAAKVLEQALPVFESDPTLSVEVGGHTDSAGDAAANLALSDRRAKAVVKWLVEHKVDAKRLTAKGYGATVPRAPNTTPEGRASNRRITFKRVGAAP
ncbi:MAG: OmpA family protein [Myxococcaceae bacterium]|nr:OmpA family protein [Myxococcaceae bacterium]